MSWARGGSYADITSAIAAATNGGGGGQHAAILVQEGVGAKGVVSARPSPSKDATAGARHAVWLRTATVALVAGLYMLLSGLAILVNKHCLVDLKFPYPVTLAWLGLLTTTVCSSLGAHVLLAREQRRGMTVRYYTTHVLPCGFAMAIAFMTGNMSFLYLTLSFIQMLKAATPVVTMLMLFAFRLEKPTLWLVTSVCVISLGVLLSGYAEGHASLLGVLTMGLSITAEALRLVLMQFLMDPKGGELHPLEGLKYISSACMVSLMGLALVWEWGPLVRTQAHYRILQFPAEFLTVAFAGFGVNLLAILVIKLASSLTLKVLGTAKDAALVVVGVLLLHEQVSKLQLEGYVISLLGFVAYNYEKFRRTQAPAGITPAAPAMPTKLA